MAGKENLIPNEQRTPEERRENASKAGKASGEARRKKRAMKSAARLLLSMGATSPAAIRRLRSMGLAEEDMTNQMAVLAAVMEKAQKGDVKAATFLRDTVGESPAAEIHRDEMKFHKEEFAYRKERDAAGDVMEVEDLQEIEATIYGKSADNPQTQDHSV